MSRLHLGIVIAFLGLTVPAVAQQQIGNSGRVDPDVEVEVFNIAGSVRVTGWERNEVRVEGTLGEGVERLAFENDGDNVEIRVVVPRSRRGDPDRQVGETHLEIMVPRRASLDIETLAASVSITDVDGSISVESSAGQVTYRGGSVEIEASSAAGDIEINATAGGAAIDIEGVAGSVLVQFVDAEVDASTLTGSLRAIGGTLRDGNFEAVSGSLYFEGAIGRGADVDFENFNGDIELLVPGDTAARFDIQTYSGSIETEFGFQGSRVEAYSPEQEAEFTLGDGGGDANVSIETFSGTVRVRRR